MNPIDVYNQYVVKQAVLNKEQRKIDNPSSLSASSAGLCHRKHWYMINNSDTKEENVDSLRLMRLGTIMGEDFAQAIDDYDTEGFEIYQETLLESKELNVVGHLDLLIVDADNKGWLYDWKTANTFKYKNIFSGKDSNPSINYELQLGTYGKIAVDMGLCEEIVHLGLVYYNKNDSRMEEKVISLDVISDAVKYWGYVGLNIMSEPPFEEGESPVYKWECGKYCNYAHICPSPLNKEYDKIKKGVKL